MKRAVALLSVSALLALGSCSFRGDAPPLAPAAQGTVEASIVSGADDLQELAFGKIIAADPTLELSQTGELVALRFTGLDVPKGVGITKAHLTLTAARASAEPSTFAVRAAALDGPLPTADGAVRGLAAGAAVASWPAGPWEPGGRYESTDLSFVVAEAVAGDAWAAGGSLVLVVSGAGGAMKTAAAFELTGLPAATLHVEYDTSVPGGGGYPGGFLGPVVLPEGSCLNTGTGPLTTITGFHERTLAARHLTNARIDGRGMRVRAQLNPFVVAYNRGSFCLSGGVMTTVHPRTADWHTTHPSHGIYFADTPSPTVEGVAVGVDNQITGDGITFKHGNPNWVFRDSYVQRAGDDAIENDRFNNGIADNILVDSAFQGMSCRDELRDYLTPRHYHFTVQNSLISLAGRATHRFIKHTIVGANYCHISLKNNVILLDDDAGGLNPNTHPNIARQGGDLLFEGDCVGAQNVVVYIGGDARVQRRLEQASPACYRVTTDRGVWDAARADWFARHPQFRQWE